MQSIIIRLGIFIKSVTNAIYSIENCNQRYVNQLKNKVNLLNVTNCPDFQVNISV